MIKILNLKLEILLENQNIKIFLPCKSLFVEGYVPNWSEEVFVIKKFKNTVSWTFVIKDEEIVKTLCRGHILLKAKKFLEHFTKKNYKKQIKKSLELKK